MIIPKLEAKMAEVETITLEFVKLGLRERITPEAMRDLDVKVIAHSLADSIIGCFATAWTPGKVTVDSWPTDPVDVPATAWDHFKAERGWKHNTRRITTRTEKRVTRVCPHLHVSMDRGPHLRFLMTKGELE